MVTHLCLVKYSTQSYKETVSKQASKQANNNNKKIQPVDLPSWEEGYSTSTEISVSLSYISFTYGFKHDLHVCGLWPRLW